MLVREKGQYKHWCDAVIGRPGNFHGCLKPAVVAGEGKFATVLEFCKDHAGRAGSKATHVHSFCAHD